MNKASYLMVSLLAFSSAAWAVDQKTVAGAVVGGVAGAVIGNEVNGEKGAALGAMIGGVAGAVIGSGKTPPLPPKPPLPGVVPVPAPVQAVGEEDRGHEGKRHGHHDNGNHYGERKHRHDKD